MLEAVLYLAIYLLLTVGTMSLVAVALVLLAQARIADKKALVKRVASMADALGLQPHSEAKRGLAGRRGPFHIRVHVLDTIRVELRPVPEGITVTGRGSPGPGLPMGDRRFDKRFRAYSRQPPRRAEVLGESARATLIEAGKGVKLEVVRGALVASVARPNADHIAGLIERMTKAAAALVDAEAAGLDGRLSGEPIPAIRRSAVKGLIQEGAGPDRLSVALRDPDPTVRAMAARELDEVEVLLELARSADSPRRLRRVVVGWLGASQRGQELLTELLQLPLGVVASTAANIVRDKRLMPALPALRALLASSAAGSGAADEQVTLSALSAAVAVGDSELETVIWDLLDHPSGRVRLRAVSTLGRIGSIDSVTHLRTASVPRAASAAAIRRIHGAKAGQQGGQLSMVEPTPEAGRLSVVVREPEHT
jgi:HEAT repeat protein